MLARDPWCDERRWRVVRFAGIVGITVTGLVHFFLLRPLLHLDGLNWWCDKTLHMVVPVLAVMGWVVFGPRPRVATREIAVALALAGRPGWSGPWWSGALTGWFPYPFLDFEEEGWGSVLATSVGITVLFLALFALAHWLDRRLPARPGAVRRPSAAQVLGDLAALVVHHDAGAGAVDQRQERRDVAALHVEHDGHVEVAERVADRVVLGHAVGVRRRACARPGPPSRGRTSRRTASRAASGTW